MRLTELLSEERVAIRHVDGAHPLDKPTSLRLLAEMLAGALTVPTAGRAHVIIEPDRAAAIGLAIAGADKGDVVVVAGKGHERGQYAGATVIPFDDREVAAEALGRQLRQAGGTGPAGTGPRDVGPRDVGPRDIGHSDGGTQ